MSSFKNLKPVDNFYQSSLFFPMPVVMIGTLSPNGQTNLGPYSLLAPYYIAGKEYYAMILECRNTSNTAQNILRTRKCTINFFPDDKKLFKEAVRMGWPGDATKEKMKGCLFQLEEGQMAEEHPDEKFPKVVKQSFQVLECTWMAELDHAENDQPIESDHYEGPFHDFNGITSPYGAHFILRIDKILMKEKYANAIINGVTKKGFPKVPVDYGYRDSKYFWCSRFKAPVPEMLPVRNTDVSSVRYAAKRLQTDVQFTDEALAKLVNIPRIFLPAALKGIVKWAEENNVKVITPAELQIINDKRRGERNKK